MPATNERVAAATRDEKALMQCSKEWLRAEAQRHRKVADFSGLTKVELVGEILRARYGVNVLRQVPGWC